MAKKNKKGMPKWLMGIIATLVVGVVVVFGYYGTQGELFQGKSFKTQTVTVTSNPAADSSGTLTVTHPASFTMTRSALPLGTVWSEWLYDHNFFNCTNSQPSVLTCSTKIETGTVYKGFSYSTCNARNLCQQANTIYVRVLPNPYATSTTTVPISRDFLRF